MVSIKVLLDEEIMAQRKTNIFNATSMVNCYIFIASLSMQKQETRHIQGNSIQVQG